MIFLSKRVINSVALKKHNMAEKDYKLYHHYQKFKDVVLLQKIFNHSTPEVTLRYIGIEEDEIFESYENFIL